MKNINFTEIKDAYQLIDGAKIKGKKYDEIFELGAYDASKRGYTLYHLRTVLDMKTFV